MAPKHPAPLEYPPSVWSSDEESDEEVEEEAAHGEEADGKEEEEEDEEEEEEDEEAGKVVAKVQVPVAQRDSSESYDSANRTLAMELKISKTVGGRYDGGSEFESEAVVQKPVVERESSHSEDTDDFPMKSMTSKDLDGEKMEKEMEEKKKVKKRKKSESDLTDCEEQKPVEDSKKQGQRVFAGEIDGA